MLANFVLLFIFSSHLYYLYFFLLIIISYLFSKKNHHFCIKIFSYGTIIVLLTINQNFYEDMIFELYLYLDLLNKIPYIYSEVMYILIVLHLTVVINLKKFENFWDIIDKKLLWWY